MIKKYLYPLWLRIWHWLFAIIALTLIYTGVSIHYPETFSFLIKYDTAIAVHVFSAFSLIALFLIYLLAGIFSGELKSYFSGGFKGIGRQFRFYFYGIFNKESNPYVPERKRRFDPLKKIFYLFLMFIFMPLIIITGIYLLNPLWLPPQLFGVGAPWLIKSLHLFTAFIISMMTAAHIYFSTSGRRASTLTKAMITGTQEIDEPREDEEPARVIQAKKGEKRFFPRSFYNPLTLTGLVIALIGLFAFIFFFFIELTATVHNPYLGIITFIGAPSILVIGLAFILIGIIRTAVRRKRSGKEEDMPVIDFNNSRHFRAAVIFIVGSIILGLLTVFGSYKAYEYTESDEFCGTTCHEVMEPEYTTYQRSPHSEVGCVECHIGSGADWFVKSKLSGSYQLYAVLMNIYPRPIQTPVENLRPAQETCERCHSPRHFYDEKKVIRDYYLSDKENTKYNLEMYLKVGGGNMEVGNTSGIHWHMNLSNVVEYYHTDRKRNDIPWVRVTSKVTGETETYYLEGREIDEKKIKDSDKLRRMDCIDCHNRPAHIITPTPQLVNAYMSIGKLDPSIPYLKQAASQALDVRVKSSDKAYSSIASFMRNYYTYKKDEIGEVPKEKLDKTIEQLHKLYKVNYFPEMNVSWKNYQNNIGHMYAQGCFRCHDGKHKSKSGKIITNDCNACHTFRAETLPAKGQAGTVVNEFVHPGGDLKNFKNRKCSDCHKAG